MEKTFAIIKPDAVASGYAGEILTMIEKDGFKIVGLKLIHMTKQEAEGFYAVHRSRPFFDALTTFMQSGACYVMVLQREGAVSKWRELIGATNPEQAKNGTIRQKYGKSIDHNAVHGSDADQTARQEISYFFSELELVK